MTSKYYYKDESGKWHIDLDWLRFQLEAGKSMAAIAKEVGCSYAVVKRFVDKLKQSNVKDDNGNNDINQLKKIDFRIQDIQFTEKSVIVKVSDSDAIIDLHLNKKMQKLQEDWFNQGYKEVVYINVKYSR